MLDQDSLLNKLYYIIIGKGPNEGDAYGLFLVDEKNAGTSPFFKVWLDANGCVVISAKDGKLAFVSDADANQPIIPEFPGFNGDIYINTGGTNTVPFHYKNGVLIGID